MEDFIDPATIGIEKGEYFPLLFHSSMPTDGSLKPRQAFFLNVPHLYL